MKIVRRIAAVVLALAGVIAGTHAYVPAVPAFWCVPAVQTCAAHVSGAVALISAVLLISALLLGFWPARDHSQDA